MAVKIKLKRMGKIRQPMYRIVVADARTKRDGRTIEEIGLYQPKQNPSLIQVDSDRVQYWLSVGAQPTEPVAAILAVTGDWQRFKGLPGAEGTLQVAAPKPTKSEVFARLVAETGEGSPRAATTPRKGRPARAKDTPDAAVGAEDASTGTPAASTPTAGEATGDAASAEPRG